MQVIVYTDWEGRSPDLVEDQITYPISTRFIAAPKVKFVRGESMFGKSFVYVIFEDGTDIYWARSRVIEYLSSVRGMLPEGVNPVIGPDATGVGWVFEYALVDETGKHNLAELRSYQDWSLRYALESVKGVAEVAPVGGFVKQYQVDLDPNKLLAYNIPLSEVVQAIKMSNADVGGKVFEIATTEYFVRGRGYIKDPRDIENVVLKVENGTPVYIRNVGTVHLGPDIRRGVAELDGKGETVGPGDRLARPSVARGPDEDQVSLGLLGELVQPARRGDARERLGLRADGLGRRLDLARVLDLGIMEVRVEALPNRVELEHAGHDQPRAGRVGELLAEHERVLGLIAVVVSNEDLAVHGEPLLVRAGQRLAATARSKSVTTPTGD